MNINVLLPSMPLVLLKAHMCRSDDILTSYACIAGTRRWYFNAQVVFAEDVRGKAAACVRYPDATFKVTDRWIRMWYGPLRNNLWWSQRGIKLFQTNITPLHSAVAVLLRVRVCPVSEKWWRNKVCVSVKGVSSQSLWFQSVTVSRDCGSVSAAFLFLSLSLFLPPLCLSFLSWVHLNTCSLKQGRAGKGFLSN